VVSTKLCFEQVSSLTNTSQHATRQPVTSLAKSIGQHLFIGIEGTELNPQNRRLLETIRPGGVVLFRRNISTKKQLLKLCHELRVELSFSPLLAIDQEGGRVNRLVDIVGAVPSVQSLIESNDPALARAFGQTIARWLRKFAIDINFAPVLDLALAEDSLDNGLQSRCWGRTSEEVVRWAGAFLDGLESGGVASCLKHFPGLGGANVDSHEKLPRIERSRKDLLSEDIQAFVPFLTRASLLMIGHASYPALDDIQKNIPASVSSKIIQELLREELGYKGLVLSDDMDMGAITKYGRIGDVAVKSFIAGSDVLLICHTPEKMVEAHEALIHAAESKQIPLGRLHESEIRLEQFRCQRAEAIQAMV